MKYPVNVINVKQGFGNGHYGIDFGWDSTIKGAEFNQPIYSVDDGIVISIQNQKTGGNVLIIRHNNGFCSEYAHLSKILVNVRDNVKKGQEVARMGATGQVTGPHLHFGLYKGTSLNYNDRSKFVDPLKYIYKEKNQIISSKSNYKDKIVEVKKIVNKVEYAKGTYKTLSAMNVRTGPGTKYSVKKVSQLTTDGKKNATSTNKNANAVYKKGTIFTAQEIIKKGSEVWAKSPSGYICIKGSSGTVYCLKV